MICKDKNYAKAADIKMVVIMMLRHVMTWKEVNKNVSALSRKCLIMLKLCK